MEQERLPLALVGAFALHAYGFTRATSDLDFVTASQAQERVIAFLASLGYETLHASAGYSNHVHADASMGRVDFIYVGAKTARKLWDRPGATLRLGQYDLPVPRAEHLVAMKVHAMKNDPRRALQDMADIRNLLQLDGIDHDEVRGYFDAAGLLEKYDEIKELL